MLKLILNVTVYSFYNYLERLMIIENYDDVTLRQILAGVDLKSKIETLGD